jgi:hypothetical protein
MAAGISSQAFELTLLSLYAWRTWGGPSACHLYTVACSTAGAQQQHMLERQGHLGGLQSVGAALGDCLVW